MPTLTIDDLDPIYFVNEHDMDAEVFSPILSVATDVRCMSGYFTSGAFSELARSLSYFLGANEAPMRFIVSPHLNSEDLEAIRRGINLDENLLPLLFPGYETTEENLRSRTLDTLAYLVASGRMELRIGLQKTGLFHTKCWIFDTPAGAIAIHGSVNATKSGLSQNTEQIALDKYWDGGKSRKVVEKIRDRFEKIWEGSYDQVDTLLLNSATVDALQELQERNENIENWASYLSDFLDEAGESPAPKIQLRVPEWLNYETGAYSHQGEAILAWQEQGRGILSVATGGGKTLTALVAATLTSQKENALLVVVAVPTKALLNQWAADVEDFGVIPFNSYGKSLKQTKRELKAQVRRLKHGTSKNEVLVITHDGLKSDLADALEEVSKVVPIMLVGDEVHNLGSIGFQSAAKDCFKYRLGLSATHIRQFDDEGTSFLLEYFGDVVYEFPLDMAIGRCLVPYDYLVHRVELEEEEQEEWAELTIRIRKLSFAAEHPDGSAEKEKWKLLCLQRRRIVESAAQKIIAFANALPANKTELQRSLVFCTDKSPSQLVEVNNLLSRRSVNFHQVTHEETANRKSLVKIVDSFNDGDLQVLTSKRVLDEGFNIPQTETAYLLASNTVRRQWIQRLGRVLRISTSTEKEKAVIHDFVVVPRLDGDRMDSDLKGLIKGEFERISFFVNLSTNGLEHAGAIALMDELLALLEVEK